MKSIVYAGIDVHSTNYTPYYYMVKNDNCIMLQIATREDKFK